MVEDLRQEADTAIFHDESEEKAPPPPAIPPNRGGRILGMTAAQRFVIALILLGITCLLSTLCLLASEKVVPPMF